MGMAKMNKKWVVLCSAAIAAVYGAGYFATESHASLPQAQQSPQVSTQPQSPAIKTNQIKPSQIKGLYKDGTFTGSGRNRRGSIQVAVTIQNDKITDVEISHFAMHYSESDVVGLPGEVMQIQNAQVNNVSGATYSTQAFKDAVQDALSQAQNA
jgi:uncharacterized protein with FMN-binding domain